LYLRLLFPAKAITFFLLFEDALWYVGNNSLAPDPAFAEQPPRPLSHSLIFRWEHSEQTVYTTKIGWPAHDYVSMTTVWAVWAKKAPRSGRSCHDTRLITFFSSHMLLVPGFSSGTLKLSSLASFDLHFPLKAMYARLAPTAISALQLVKVWFCHIWLRNSFHPPPRNHPARKSLKSCCCCCYCINVHSRLEEALKL